MKNYVVSNLEDLKKDVMKSCIRANRNINHINIVAVSKTINKFPIIDGLIPELINCFQLIIPLSALIENISFLLLEKYMFFLLKTISELFSENESSVIVLACVGVCHKSLPFF